MNAHMLNKLILNQSVFTTYWGCLSKTFSTSFFKIVLAHKTDMYCLFDILIILFDIYFVEFQYAQHINTPKLVYKLSMPIQQNCVLESIRHRDELIAHTFLTHLSDSFMQCKNVNTKVFGSLIPKVSFSDNMLFVVPPSVRLSVCLSVHPYVYKLLAFFNSFLKPLGHI